MKKTRWIALLLVLTLAAFLPLAGAGAEVFNTAQITATIAATGTSIQNMDEYTVCMKATNGGPMPEGTEEGVFSMTRTGPGDVTFPTLSFTTYGVYTYDVWQLSGSHPSAVSYDPNVYTVKIFVTNANVPAQLIYINGEKKVTEVLFTNEYAETSVSATKVWDDADNQDGRRGDVTLSLRGSVTVGGETTLVPVTNPERGIAAGASTEELTVSWTALPVYYQGAEITYSVIELGTVTSEGATHITLNGGEYTVTVAGSAAEGFVVTNSYTPEETEASVRKVWDDASDQDRIRPKALIVTLSNGETVELSESNGWTATLTGLPKYAAGKEIVYTWTEPENIEGYELVSQTANGTMTILTNRHETDKTLATVMKVWDDANNQDGIRPETLTVTLSNGMEVELSEENHWTATIENLPKNEEGVEIEYTWTETTPEGYTLTSNVTEGTLSTLTNKHQPEEISLGVKKNWIDGENSNNTRPASLVVTLSNGMSVTLSEANNWEGMIEHLPVYAQGEEIEYTWNEGEIPRSLSLRSSRLSPVYKEESRLHSRCI